MGLADLVKLRVGTYAQRRPGHEVTTTWKPRHPDYCNEKEQSNYSFVQGLNFKFKELVDLFEEKW